MSGAEDFAIEQLNGKTYGGQVGTFGNDGRLFRESMAHEFPGAYQRVIFAIMDWSVEKKIIGPFREAFGQ